MNASLGRALIPPLRDMRNHAVRRWAGLSWAGRRVITICAALLGMGLSWALVYEPLQSSLAKNRIRIQELRAQLSIMREQATAVQSIRTMAPVAASATLGVADVAGLQALFGPRTIVTIAINSSPGNATGVATFKVAVDQAPYSVLIDRLEQATGRYRVRVLSMTLVRSSAAPAQATMPALVSGEILLVDSQ
ncbi:MAG: type II secretion system protein M [Rhodocyclaceae bacterium]|nr:type II secretion system protein M [Rhodocyclaceae bacterium]